MRFRRLLMTVCLVLINALANASSGTIDPVAKFAYAENAGFINFAATGGGVTVARSFLNGYAWFESVGWIQLGSGNGPFANTTAVNWGVNVAYGANAPGGGVLSGYAWNENSGWINFAPAYGGVTIGADGVFNGLAWSETLGWIQFDNTSATTVKTEPINTISTTTVSGTLSPTMSVSGQNVTIPFTVSVNAPGSGTPTGNVIVSDGTAIATVTATSGTATLKFSDANSRNISIAYQGNADFSASSAIPFSYTVNPANTTVVIGAISPSVALTGQSIVVPFSVSVNSPGNGTPTGNVLIGDGVSSVTVPASAGTATVGLATIGVRTLTVAYQGDLNFSASSATTSCAINKAKTSLNVGTISPANAAVGQAVSIPFSVTVNAPGGGVPTGDATVTDGVTTVTVHLSDSVATLTFPTAGPRNITITYPGDANYTGSSGNITYTVSTGPSKAPVITSPATATGVVGSPFTFMITSTGSAPVTYTAQPLPNGLSLTGAAISGTPTSAGTTSVNLTASNVDGSGSQTLVITTNSPSLQIKTQISASTPPVQSPSQKPQTVTLAATVTPVGGNFAVNEGTVSFQLQDSNNSNVGSAVASLTISSGNASVTYTIPGGTVAGIYSIVASYMGTASFAPISDSTSKLTIQNISTTTAAASAQAIRSPSPQQVTLKATVTGSLGAINEGAVTFQLKDSINANIGAAITSSAIVGGNASVSYTLPAALALGTYTISASFSGTLTYVGSSDAKSFVTVIRGGQLIPVISSVTVDRNPARTNTPVTLTAVGVSNVQPLSYIFSTVANNLVQTPPLMVVTPASGLSASFTTQFTTEGVNLIAVQPDDGVDPIPDSLVRITVNQLEPNAGTTEQNIFNNGAATNSVTNPTNGLGISVSSSVGGALNFDSITGSSLSARATETYTFLVNGTVTDSNAVKAPNSAAKFLTHGINVIELDAVSGANARQSRIMVPISKAETGESLGVVDTRSSKAPVSTVKGKLSVTKPCSIQFTSVVELSAGLLLTDMAEIEFGASNFHTKITVDAKGKLTAPINDSHFSNVKITMPKVNKTTNKTDKGAAMKITFTLTGSGNELIAKGLGTDGVNIVSKPTKGTVLPLNLQHAVIVGGMTYQALIAISYTPNSDFGTIAGRATK